jgi:hypothetical protein
MRPKDKFLVFISWSDSPAKEIAIKLKRLLEDILIINPGIDFFCSDTGIGPGARGRDVIEEKLAKADFGILILTENNTRNPWLMYEAGAIAKHKIINVQDSEGNYYTVIEKNRVCPIYFARKNSDFKDFTSPIFEEQRIKYRDGEERFLNLLLSIYEVKYGRLTPDRNEVLKKELNNRWKDFSQAIDEILKTFPSRPKKIDDLSNPGKLPELMMDDEIYESILSKREDTLKALIEDLSGDSSSRIIFFGGISSILRDEETIKKFADWLIKHATSKMFFCHESKGVVEIRKETLTGDVYDGVADNQEELEKRKIEEFRKMQIKLLSMLGGKAEGRIFSPEITKPPAGYIIIVGTSFYYTPVWEKRGEKTFTFKLKHFGLCQNLIDYMSSNMIGESSEGQEMLLAELALIRKEIKQEHERQRNVNQERRTR